MRQWVLAPGVAVVVGLGAFAWIGGLAGLMLRFPSLLGTISRIVDPIGPNREVVWERGPETPDGGAGPGERPPNVVVILVDDLGWNDLTWNGGGVAGGTVPTPNIDSIARDGVEFAAGYTGNATCAPSRAAILTGRYPMRFGFESTPAPPAMGRMMVSLSSARASNGAPRALFHADLVDQVPPMTEQGVPPEEITIAELLATRGYHNVMLGKWHLGEVEGKRPHEQGFHQALGFWPGGQLYGDPDDPEIVSIIQDFDPIDQFIWKVLPFSVRMNDGPRFTPSDYMTDYLSEQAVAAIDANRHRPFFMYLAYNAPHTPLQAKRSDYDALSHIEGEGERIYAAMIRSLDRGVGQVLDALREHGLEENTLVIFSSDNGGAHYIGLPEVNHPYRGWKMTFFEGGLRSPFFLKWPARLPAGVKREQAAAHIDVFATVAAAGGAPLPPDRKIDGVNLLPFASGENTGPAHDSLFWRSGHYGTVLAGGWKLQSSSRPDKRWLFNLNEDPTEQNNLAEQLPDKTAELVALLDRYNAEVGPPGWPAIVEGVIPVDRPLNTDPVPGEEYVYWPN